MTDTEFVSDKNFKEKHDRQETFFNREGKEPAKNERVFGKRVVKEAVPAYYILTHQGLPYDPLGAHGRRVNEQLIKIKRVSKNTFDFYFMYLATNNNIYLTKASRGMIND